MAKWKPTLDATATTGGVRILQTMSEKQALYKPRNRGHFKKGDPRINRIKAGPGRPPKNFVEFCRDLFHDPAKQEAVARHLFRRRRDGTYELRRDRLGRVDPLVFSLLGYAFGKPTARVETSVQYDLSKLTRDELETLARIGERLEVNAPFLARGAVPEGRGGGQAAH